jgi:hypothetical protein
MGRPPTAGNATSNTFMGKVKSSPYAGMKLQEPAPTPKVSPLPVYIALVAVSGLVLMLIRQRSNPAVQTGPLVVLDAVPNQSSIDNLTQSILALSGQTPTGGVSTPLTTTGA